MPRSWWWAPRIRNYLLFDATGLIYFLVAFVAIRVIWALGTGRDSWDQAITDLSNPFYIAFHAVALASVIFVAIRLFSLFPKAQPRDTGLPMPPNPVIKGLLYVTWLAVTVVFAAILSGGVF